MRYADLVCTTKPKNATHWTCAALGKKFNISANSVSIILRERKLKPHLVQSFQFSNDKHFDEKLDDKEFLKFLEKLSKETDPTKVLHVIIDNYATHKTKEGHL